MYFKLPEWQEKNNNLKTVTFSCALEKEHWISHDVISK